MSTDNLTMGISFSLLYYYSIMSLLHNTHMSYFVLSMKDILGSLNFGEAYDTIMRPGLNSRDLEFQNRILEIKIPTSS